MALMRIKPLCRHCLSYDGPNHNCITVKDGWRTEVRTSNGYRISISSTPPVTFPRQEHLYGEGPERTG